MSRYPPSTIHKYRDLPSTQRIQTHNSHIHNSVRFKNDVCEIINIEEGVSGVALSVLCEIYMFIWTYFDVVLLVCVPAQFSHSVSA